MNQESLATAGYWEASHYPINPGRTWNQAELLEAARKSKCRNTGWPIGVVLSSPEHAPKPVSDGIRASIRSEIGYDYWSLAKQGAFYFLRNLEEDSARSKVKNALFFDLRIWRVAELFLHCSKLYQALDVLPTTEIEIQIVHSRLKGRVLTASDWNRAITMLDRKCEEDIHTWQYTVQLGLIEPKVESLVKDALGSLFLLFEFWEPDEIVWKQLIGEFLKSKV